MLSAEGEKNIGKRLREFRESLRIARTAFAVEIGIGNERLASYEGGRVALPWGVFSAISKRFMLNPLWLATGRYSPTVNAPLEEKGFASVDARKRFSEVVLGLIAEAGNPEIFEVEQKISAIRGNIAEVLSDSVKNGVSSETLAKIEKFSNHWQSLGGIVLAETKLKVSKAARLARLAGADSEDSA